MYDLLHLCWLEMRKTLSRSVLFSGLSVAIMMGLVVALRGRQFPGTFEVKHALYFYGVAAEIFMAVLMAKALGDEFYYKTSTALFSSSSSRTRVLFVKMLYNLWISLIFAIVAIGVDLVAEWILNQRVSLGFQIQMALRIIPAYFLFAAAAGSFLTAVGTVTLNIVGPLIAYVVIFWLLPGTLELLLKEWLGLQGAGPLLAPLYLRSYLIRLEVSLGEAFALSLFGLSCFLLAIGVLNRRDLR
ncbi:hypothetical protein HRbin09_01805 [bacterium HR09]|nr:hypothetical protein HRbin09_01805 [bacterium HR09]